MKKITAIAAVLLGITSVASAADMAVKARPMAAPPPIIYNWTGFYFGGNIGGLWDNNNDVDVVSLVRLQRYLMCRALGAIRHARRAKGRKAAFEPSCI